jgi:hypothetical protein
MDCKGVNQTKMAPGIVFMLPVMNSLVPYQEGISLQAELQSKALRAILYVTDHIYNKFLNATAQILLPSPLKI